VRKKPAVPSKPTRPGKKEEPGACEIKGKKGTVSGTIPEPKPGQKKIFRAGGQKPDKGAEKRTEHFGQRVP